MKKFACLCLLLVLPSVARADDKEDATQALFCANCSVMSAAAALDTLTSELAAESDQASTLQLWLDTTPGIPAGDRAKVQGYLDSAADYRDIALSFKKPVPAALGDATDPAEPSARWYLKWADIRLLVADYSTCISLSASAVEQGDWAASSANAGLLYLRLGTDGLNSAWNIMLGGMGG